jgi:hypothetical protein
VFVDCWGGQTYLGVFNDKFFNINYLELLGSFTREFDRR